MTKKQGKSVGIDVQALLDADDDYLRSMVSAIVEATLEAEMTAAVGAEKGERTPGRLGYRSGYYTRSLVTRVGTLDLRVPQDRDGRFSTRLFERYQRSEKALVAALAEMYVQGAPEGSGTLDLRGVLDLARRDDGEPGAEGSGLRPAVGSPAPLRPERPGDGGV